MVRVSGISCARAMAGEGTRASPFVAALHTSVTIRSGTLAGSRLGWPAL